MFKNLYRLRLLDFFELTAATAGALYVYQLDDWWDWEKPWVIGALSIAAILTWTATRVGKTAPIPGHFLAAYTGALYGLSDLSPWMAIFGRLGVIETALKLFPKSMPVGGWQERCTTVAVITVLMAVPAIFFGCTWAASWNLIQRMQKKFEPPKTLFGGGLVITQFLTALIFITGLSYYSLRPQIRLVRTIRIPIQYQTIKPQTPQETEHDEAPIIAAWTTSRAKPTILVMSSDLQLVEYDLLSGVPRQKFSLGCEKVWSGRRQPQVLSFNSLFVLNRREHIELFEWDAKQVLLHRQGYNTDQDSFERVNLVDGTARRLLLLEDARASSVKAISNNGEYAVIQNGGADRNGLVTLSVWNLVTLTRIRDIEMKEEDSDERKIPLIDNSGQKMQLTAYCQNGLSTRQVASRIRSVSADTPACEMPQMTNDGKYISGPLTLLKDKAGQNLLARYENLAMHSVMNTVNGSVVLFGADNSMELETNAFVPLMESLLRSAHLRQVTVFDPRTKRSQTSWFRTKIVHDPDSSQAKFTSNGKYMIIQDEDESADLFHIFAMP